MSDPPPGSANPIVAYGEKLAGLPVLFTHNYSEVTPAYLERRWAEMTDDAVVWDFSALYVSSYTRASQQAMARRCNYWMSRREWSRLGGGGPCWQSNGTTTIRD